MTKKIYGHVPVLVREDDPDGNAWGVEFQQGLFNMTSDSDVFRTADELTKLGAVLDGNVWINREERFLPLYEGKMVHLFDHRFGTYTGQTQAQANKGFLPYLSDDEHNVPSYLVQPRYWVSEAEVRGQMRADADWLLGFRDVTNPVVERTMIAGALPIAAIGHKVPLVIFDATVDPRCACILPAVLSSFAHDFVARQKIGGTSMGFFIVKQLAVLTPRTLRAVCTFSSSTTFAEWLAPRCLELTYTAWDLQGFSIDLGWNGPPFRWDPARRELLRAELDAAFFHLYALEREDVDYVMGTFPIVRRKDEAKHGEYRTKRLILERYDAMTKAIATGSPYETPLDPPPANPSCTHPESTRPSWAAYNA